jgi:hypothetical protein
MKHLTVQAKVNDARINAVEPRFYCPSINVTNRDEEPINDPGCVQSATVTFDDPARQERHNKGIANQVTQMIEELRMRARKEQ